MLFQLTVVIISFVHSVCSVQVNFKDPNDHQSTDQPINQQLSLKLRHVIHAHVEEKPSLWTDQLVFQARKPQNSEVKIFRHDVEQDQFIAEASDSFVQTVTASKSRVNIRRLSQIQAANSKTRGFTDEDEEKVKIKSNYIYPDAYDASTVINLAKMSNNAYNEFNASSDWWDIDGHHTNISFGRDAKGLRGFVYASDDNKLMVIAIKGTSTKFFGFGGGDTGSNDKYHDNLMFSCCCAAVDWSWTPVCGCSALRSICSNQCMSDTIDQPDSYYNMAKGIFNIIQQLYPEQSIWLTGHSLGGAIAAVTALDLGVAAITFEAPGDRLYAERLFVAGKEGNSKVKFPNGQYIVPIWQFGVSSDPLFTGKCNGPYSLCYADGYAMESKCHVGNVCVLSEPQSRKQEDHDDGEGVPPQLMTHRIQYVVKRLQELQQDKNYKPECHVEDRSTCTDCDWWLFSD